MTRRCHTLCDDEDSRYNTIKHAPELCIRTHFLDQISISSYTNQKFVILEAYGEYVEFDFVARNLSALLGSVRICSSLGHAVRISSRIRIWLQRFMALLD